MENREEAAIEERAKLLALHRKNSVRSMVAVVIILIIIFSVGIRAYIMAKNSSAGAFWPAVPMLLAVTFAYTGLSLKSMGKTLLVASIVVMCGAIIACLVGAITDGTAAETIHHTDFSLCHYSTENDYTPPCIANQSRRYYTYPKGYCLCCYQWRNSYLDNFWSSVDSCDDISVTFQNLLWTSMAFNVFGIVACVITCSFVAGYVSLLNAEKSIGNPGIVLPQQYMARPQPFIFAQPNLAQQAGQIRITPSVPAGPTGDFRSRLDPRLTTDRESR